MSAHGVDDPDPTVAQPAVAQPTVEELKARIAELEARRPDVRPSRWRGAAAVVLVVIGALLVPFAAVAGWARTAVFDTDAFVATYAPLARDPQVQAFVTEQAVAAIDQQLDVAGLVGEVVDGLSGLLPNRPRVAAALRALQTPAVAGVQSAMNRAAAEVVGSEAFATVWETSLRVSHAQLLAALQGDPHAALAIDDRGIGLQLGPIVAQIRTTLIERGFSLASAIPSIDRTIVLVPSSELVRVQAGYRLAVAAGAWLPWLALAFLAGGVLLARRRTAALVGVGVGVALGTALALVALAVAEALVLAGVPASVVPGPVMELLFATVTQGLATAFTIVLVLGVVVALAAWLVRQRRRPGGRAAVPASAGE
ncbi:MAG TPA: hypothetical protein PKA07_17310 [Micropruina sp.]|nr:hypothetical protein [Micropruina sp.]